ncbi:MAG: PLP-dependent aminotransferase family protein, partial [Alphaproteobacteria bacterium]|nr:PLP-dependent aminotransferase family protein [Alphaproteobacteria bacterium]
SGMHLLGWLGGDADDAALSRAAGARGVSAVALSRFYVEDTPRQGFLLGYAGVGRGAMEEGAATLADVLRGD